MASEFLKTLNLKEKLVTGDGHCLFRCVAHQLFGLAPDDDSIMTRVCHLRSVSVDFWAERLTDQDIWNTFVIKASESVCSKHVHDEVKRVETYLYNMKHGVEWADEEILVALSTVYQIRMVVILKESGEVFPIGEEHSRTIYLVYYPGVHYNSVESVHSEESRTDFYLASQVRH